MKAVNVYLALGAIAILGACATPRDGTPFDEVPMYGGMERQAVPQLKAADDWLISGASKEFGSREKASMAWVNRGFTLYRQDDLAGAMRRFNQAWLLDPNNPEVYWGFASVLYDQAMYCDAMKMSDLAFSKGPIQDGFLPDAAINYVGCAISDKSLDQGTKSGYLAKSEQLFENALSSPTVRKEYVLYHWARAMYGREDYANAWRKVAEYRKATGKEFPEAFLRNLRQKMPEPAAQ